MEFERKEITKETTDETAKEVSDTKSYFTLPDNGEPSFDFLKKRFDGEMNYQVKKTIFRKKKELYNFMKETKAYLCGSFALAVNSILRIHDAPNDMDFFIEVKEEEDIPVILGRAICKIYSLGITQTTIKRTKDKYDSWSKKIIVYEIKAGSFKIDLVFIFESIDSIIESFDFNMLKNYIRADEENEDKFIYNSKCFKDILNCEINISQKYIQQINDTIKNYECPEIVYGSLRCKLKERLKKYCNRGYRIAKVGLAETEEDCCCCYDKMKEMNSLFMCNHGAICTGCVYKLKNKECPLCRAKKSEYNFQRMWEEIVFIEDKEDSFEFV